MGIYSGYMEEQRSRERLTHLEINKKTNLEDQKKLIIPNLDSNIFIKNLEKKWEPLSSYTNNYPNSNEITYQIHLPQQKHYSITVLYSEPQKILSVTAATSSTYSNPLALSKKDIEYLTDIALQTNSDPKSSQVKSWLAQELSAPFINRKSSLTVEGIKYSLNFFIREVDNTGTVSLHIEKAP